ncbi:hypothetical protein E0500_010255 [Streptomyces sp. KM273126]|uniref:hypothetical protein n=1 Tax=Streptomyces sp. KM273126 TaxID=2545247 RepID=UPI001038ABBC|nr:hypothetical protein [Streptomyces sp. KM273126]MBA2807781.1 hypothetical protein [Streptomyces sp. KM273126]
MSAGVAIPSLDLVSPAVAFPPPPPPVGAYALPHTGATPLDYATDASTHLSDAVGHGLGEAADAALQVLGSLSGVLLAGRAALLTTRALASAAVRAAEEQRCLERQEEISAAAAEQWQAAAYAVARANARRAALLARAARATAAEGGGEGPPRPELPPWLDPVGRRLGELRDELARFEEAVRNAEKTWTAWEVRQLTAVLDTAAEDEGDDAWRRMIRDRQKAMVDRHMETRTAQAEQAEETVTVVPRVTADPRQGTEAVRQLGADILAALDPQADPKTAALAAAAVGSAVRRATENPAKARRHLGDARRVVQDANRKAVERRARTEWAAAQLDFLTRRAPEGADPLPEAPDAEKPLRRLLEDEVPLGPEERRLVELRVTERLNHLESLYVHAQCSQVLAELAARYGGPADATRPEGQELRLDWTPEGWGPDHWLRATLTGGTFRVATMYRGGPGERRPEDRRLDDERCAEARRRLEEFTEVARDLGLTVAFRIEQTEGARPGLLGEDGTVVLDGDALTGVRRDAAPQDEQSPPIERVVGEDGRRGHRRR